MRKTAELQVRDAVELKRLAEESARVAWAEMQVHIRPTLAWHSL